MVNVLFVEDNFHYSKNLINKVMSENPEVRLYRMITNGKEALNILKNEDSDIDIVLLDLKLPGCSGVDIIRELEHSNNTKYKESVIAISGDILLLNQIIRSPYLYTYINKITGIDEMMIIINKLIEIKKYDKLPIESKVKKELESINYDFKYLGTNYLFDSILLICHSKFKNNIKLEKNIYPKIAKKYNTTVNSVKTNILNSTREMYYNCEEGILVKRLGILYDEKPKPKDIIFTIIDRILFNLNK